jgi:hypothetical protein
LSDAAAGLSDGSPAAAGGLGSVVKVPAGVAAPVGEGATADCSECDVGVDTGVPATAGEGSPTGGSGLAATTGVATAAGEGCSESGVAAGAGVATTAEDCTAGSFGVAAGGVGVCIPAVAASVTD